MSDRRLRVQHILVQPVLFWDDDEEAEPGPQMQPLTLTRTQTIDMLTTLPDEIQALQTRLLAEGDA